MNHSSTILLHHQYQSMFELADVDADTDLDLVIADHNNITSSSCSTPQGKVTLWLNNGSASFSKSTEYCVPQNPDYVRVGNVDGSGNVDLAVEGGGDITVIRR